jgi:hypothetical protein
VRAVGSRDPDFLLVAAKELRVGDRLDRSRLVRASTTRQDQGQSGDSTEQKFHQRDSFLTKT